VYQGGGDVKIETKTSATITFDGEEVPVFRAVCGLAGFVVKRCGQEYGWTDEDKAKAQKILLNLYHGLDGSGPIFNDRRKGA